jgi:hypothetical protein
LKLCECGCGQPAPLAPRTRNDAGWIKGQPLQFIKGHRGKVNKICEWCKQPFTVTYSRNHVRTCSHLCGNRLLWSINQYPIGHIVESQGYLRIKMPYHPNANKSGYIYYHRYIVEQHLGYILDKTYDVHHIDENKKNNDISNLVAIKHDAHLRIHMLKRHKEKRELNAIRRNDS